MEMELTRDNTAINLSVNQIGKLHVDRGDAGKTNL
jgi:hypothetical protein